MWSELFHVFKTLNPKTVLNFFLEEETKNWAPFSHDATSQSSFFFFFFFAL